MEKTLRVLSGDDNEGGHSHSHSHSHSHHSSSNGHSSSVSTSNQEGLRSRSEKSKEINGTIVHDHDHDDKKAAGPSKLSAYLNLFGDFVHNMFVIFFSFLFFLTYSNLWLISIFIFVTNKTEQMD